MRTVDFRILYRYAEQGKRVIEKGVQLSCSGPAEQHSSPRSVQAGAQITALGMRPHGYNAINHSPLFCTTAVAVTVANTSVQFHRLIRQCRLSLEAWLWRQASSLDMLALLWRQIILAL
ncbi:unnamed protein product [Ceratitis capitata]|uniref:(Mediterranean fruit fly) hypothetical protein n=1 Tax=Ceratitis capitata TaxID=7213 RepID=A0A811V028_CERCA|nr:unnamed protein product [Ceratitis capitata]